MMKSVKEQAKEHAPYTREDSWSRIQKCIIAQTSFEAGANYVLEEIDEFMKDSPHVSYTSYTAIKEMIEQLKK